MATQKAPENLRLSGAAGTRPAYVHLAAFLLPVLGMALGFAAAGVFPFGDKSALQLDLNSQYISFLSYYRNEILLGDGDFFYTFAKALGGDMAGFSAYYLLSPFNLLLLLFPTRLLPVGVSLITLAKIGCAGLAMSLLLNRAGCKVESLLFSVPYALMDYVVAFHFNIMWLDGILLLPLVVLGIEKLLDGESPAIYVLALGATIAINYYIGYIICLFSLLYFMVAVLFLRPQPVGGWGRRGALAPVWRFAGASLLGGGLSAMVLLPAVLSLRGGKAGFAAESFFDKSYASLADVVSRYLPGTANPQQVFFGYPAIYCGMLALVCTVLYFTNRWVPRRARLGAGLLLVFVAASFCMGPLDRVWHGFNKPVGFLFRYSFLFSFLLLYFGWQGFVHMRGRMVRRDMPVLLGALVSVMLLAQRESHTHVTIGKLTFGLSIAVLIGYILWLYTNRKFKYAVALLLVLALADVGGSMYLSVRRAGYVPLQDYTVYVDNEGPVIDGIKQRDAGFYRLEKDYAYSDNDGFLLGYNGLSHFSSADKMAVRGFLDRMGLSDGGYGVKYTDGTTVGAESLLGMKYLVTTGAGTVKPYDLIEQVNDRLVYQNPTALPLGVMTADTVLGEWLQEGSLFDQYNAMWRAILPELQQDMYRPVAAQLELVEMTGREHEGETLFEKAGENSLARYTLMTESDDTLYALFTTQNERNADLYINGVNTGRFLFNDRHGVVAIGSFEPGTVVQLDMVPLGYELFIKDAVFVYEDSALLKEICQTLQTNAYDPDVHTQSRFSGLVENGGDGRNQLLLTIPYEEGWQAKVDGEKVALQPALGVLTSLPVPEGSHQVELWFIPPGFAAGVALTLASALGLVLWLLWRRRGQRSEK